MKPEEYRLMIGQHEGTYQSLGMVPDPRSPIQWIPSTFSAASQLSIDAHTLGTFVRDELKLPYRFVLSPFPSENGVHAKIDNRKRVHCFLNLETKDQEIENDIYRYDFVRQYAQQARRSLQRSLVDAIVLHWSTYSDEVQQANLAVSTAIAATIAVAGALGVVTQASHGDLNMDWQEAARLLTAPFYTFMATHAFIGFGTLQQRRRNKSLHRAYGVQPQDRFMEYAQAMLPVNEVQRLLVPSLKLASRMPHDIILPSPDCTEHSFVPPRK